jgi:Uma2 family endonuclease
MASVPKPLTIEEFHRCYSGKKPYYEFWFGEAIQKSMPTWLHGVLQRILGEFLVRAGYKTGSEVELRIDPDWEPVPDLIATRKKVEQPYPTTPVEIVIEILSPDDRMMHVLQKCRHYSRIGITKVFVLDPEGRQAWKWNAGCLELIEGLKLTNGETIDLAEVWQELAKQI